MGAGGDPMLSESEQEEGSASLVLDLTSSHQTREYSAVICLVSYVALSVV